MRSRAPKPPKPGGAICFLARICGGSRKTCLSLPLSVSALCCRYDALLPHQHSPRPKSASHPQCPPPNPAGNLVSARVGGKCSALRTRGRDPLRSTSRRLGLTTNPCLGILVTGSWWARSGSCCLQDPLGCSINPRLASGAGLLGCVSPPCLHRLEAQEYRLGGVLSTTVSTINQSTKSTKHTCCREANSPFRFPTPPVI